ncbi:MAG: type VI secretion system-associated protein TagF [Woeseiaceae bacterium]
MVSQHQTTGLHGKLPAHGDFVQRNLSAGFINIWDEWLQHFIAGTKEQLGENWLDIYLTSPLWRFVFSSGVIDENNWAGIMIPSVDRVGRYYPFSIVKKLPQNINPFEYMQLQTRWFSEIETLALDSLDGKILIDDLVKELDDMDETFRSDYLRSGFNLNSDTFQFDMSFSENSAASVYPLLLDSMLMKSFQSYSVWQTTGSELFSPCLFSSQGLPDIQKMPAMINGDWKSYQWQQPFKLSEEEIIESQEIFRDEA